MGDHVPHSLYDLNSTDSICSFGVAMNSGLCANCTHFVRRKRGKRGGLKGICELSGADRLSLNQYGYLRPVGTRKRCRHYSPEYHQPVIRTTSPHSTTAHAYCPVCDQIIKDFRQKSCLICGALLEWDTVLKEAKS